MSNNAPRDENTIAGLVAASSVDGTPVVIKANPLTGALKTEGSSSSSSTQIQNSNSEVINPATDETLNALRKLLVSIANPNYVDKSANQVRVQVNTGSLSGVTTVTTVAGLTNIDSYQGKLLMVGINSDAWANTCRRLIS